MAPPVQSTSHLSSRIPALRARRRSGATRARAADAEDPRSKIQDPEKIQDSGSKPHRTAGEVTNLSPRPAVQQRSATSSRRLLQSSALPIRKPAARLGFGVWIFSGSWILDLGSLRHPLLFVALLLIAFAGSSHAQPIVSQIIITNVGPAAASEALVRANIRAKAGEPFSQT